MTKTVTTYAAMSWENTRLLLDVYSNARHVFIHISHTPSFSFKLSLTFNICCTTFDSKKKATCLFSLHFFSFFPLAWGV